MRAVTHELPDSKPPPPRKKKLMSVFPGFPLTQRPPLITVFSRRGIWNVEISADRMRNSLVGSSDHSCVYCTHRTV
eukprot:COSAG02_NODE_148_length_33809_cov_158.369594_2_plen_76_part_00